MTKLERFFFSLVFALLLAGMTLVIGLAKSDQVGAALPEGHRDGVSLSKGAAQNTAPRAGRRLVSKAERSTVTNADGALNRVTFSAAPVARACAAGGNKPPGIGEPSRLRSWPPSGWLVSSDRRISRERLLAYLQQYKLI